MRNLMRLMAISIMAVTAAAVTSCGKEESAGEKTADELLGTWQLVKEVDEFDGLDDDFADYCYKSGRKYYACSKMYDDHDDYYFNDKTISYFDCVK